MTAAWHAKPVKKDENVPIGTPLPRIAADAARAHLLRVLKSASTGDQQPPLPAPEQTQQASGRGVLHTRHEQEPNCHRPWQRPANVGYRHGLNTPTTPLTVEALQTRDPDPRPRD
jgi:hypothetical protein